MPRLLRRAAAGFGLVFAGLLVGAGWLYVLRGLHWLGIGPRVSDALPLLQLAGFDGQPLLRVLVAWALAGVPVGVAWVRLARWQRALPALALGLALLLVGSQAAYALARNLPFTHVLFSRTPGLGPVLEALAFAGGCALARPLTDRERARAARGGVARIGGLGDRRLRSG